ncbi:hypothetical protein D1BOALGB6SA_7519 [Olavius sp. associated proteobacterium Delta 1]|nr:hypothetical protein D1BOALGB6SA_7519 [Olavius sp. associated proteobacterium Delta 1]
MKWSDFGRDNSQIHIQKNRDRHFMKSLKMIQGDPFSKITLFTK